jgi:8-amino-7-oxononanoate synthase
VDAPDVSTFSLADFYFSDGPDPLVPPQDFTEWRSQVTWATSLYEQAMVGGPVPRTSLIVDGVKRPILNFASYNYLGLAKHPETIAAATRALQEYGVGACGSPILSGMTDLHRELEQRLSAFLGRDETMLFNSGFGGALGMLAGVLRKGDVAILDGKSHVSLVEGARLSGARLELFEHNDPASLDALLTRHAGKRRVVVTEGVFSMDGDMADLPRLVPVAERHGVGIAIDEAHSVLACGATGRGVTEHFGMDDRITLKYATFSKAFAAIGGFISGPRTSVDYLRFFANSYGFSCALPPAVVAATLAGLDVATRDSTLRDRLADNAHYFRTQLHGLGLDTGDSTTHVVPIVVGSDRRLLYEAGLELRARGLFMAIVDYPSVPEGGLRYRASVTAAHTRADLDEALNILADTLVPRLGSRS